MPVDETRHQGVAGALDDRRLVARQAGRRPRDRGDPAALDEHVRREGALADELLHPRPDQRVAEQRSERLGHGSLHRSSTYREYVTTAALPGGRRDCRNRYS